MFCVALIATAVMPLASQTPPAQKPFEVLSVKAIARNGGRGVGFIGANNPNQFVVTGTLKFIIMTAYGLLDYEVSGPAWMDSDAYDIVAITSAESRPTREQQTLMFRKLLADSFHLTFHAEYQESSIYVLTVATNGIKVRESVAPPDQLPELINQMLPGNYVRLPARNATIR